MTRPADTHVHSEWSWDTGGPSSAAVGTMAAVCERAVRIGLPAVVFTEHLDLETTWRADKQDLPSLPHLFDDNGYIHIPRMDVVGYLDSIERCRHRFPDLRILTGVEFGQPHLFEADARQTIDLDALDRVNGSLHMLPFGADRTEPVTLYRHEPADHVMRTYLDEIPRMVSGSDCFAVVTHLDYAARSWPSDIEGPFDPLRFEDEIRTALRAIAQADRALEMNTSRVRSWLPQWWAEEGGRAVSFGSDAHTPDVLARDFAEAAELVERSGFRPGRRPEDFWTR